jgi:undecaprenol kinase
MLLDKARRSFRYALNGLKTVWKEEHNFQIEVVVAVLVLFSLYYFQFSLVESALVVLAVIIVITAEIVNTAVEDICNKIEPEFDHAIGKIKDTMAAYVLVAVGGSIVLGILVFIHHFCT